MPLFAQSDPAAAAGTSNLSTDPQTSAQPSTPATPQAAPGTNLIQQALQQLNRSNYQIAKVSPDTDSQGNPNGGYTAMVLGPDNAIYQMSVSAKGDITAPPVAVTPGEKHAAQLTPIFDPNDNNKQIGWRDPDSGAMVKFDQPTSATQNPYPGGVHQLADGSTIGIDSSGNTHTIAGSGKYDHIDKNALGQIVGVKSDGTVDILDKSTTADANAQVNKQPPPETDYEKQMADLTAKRDAASAAAQQATAEANKTANDLKAQMDAWTRAYQANQLSEQQYRDNLTQANQQAQQAIDKANVAITAARDSQTAWYQQADIAIKSGQLSEQTQKDIADQFAAANKQQQDTTTTRAQTGTTLINDRMQQANSMLNQFMGLANNKDFGIGAGGVPNISGLPQAIQDWTASLAGGPSTYDAAAQMVHAASPDGQPSPANAGYTAILGQMMDKFKQLSSQQGPSTPPPPTSNPGSTPIPPASNGPTAPAPPSVPTPGSTPNTPPPTTPPKVTIANAPQFQTNGTNFLGAP